ncbi:hypothetical protein HPB51_008040 [Rhipicephalus microplus]|uniref:Uncharacterized protein n=1 Tax=Rhipicephalus microplus TaxID=6941 RepID=A0A9J6ESJ2_RHIMP|nr:hypothetical protein HPB51_008040 [Rhipicephalus microplus]
MREASKTPGKRCGDRTSVTPLLKYSRDKANGSYGSTKCELGLAKVTDYVVSTDTWKGRLDFDRPCTAAVPGKRCWLSSELTSWNRVLCSLNYELVETRPGFNCLKKADCYNCYSDKSLEDVTREAAFLISWLLQHHFCIEEFSLLCPMQCVYEALLLHLSQFA